MLKLVLFSATSISCNSMIKKSSERRAAETVTEENFTLLFRWYFSIAGGGVQVVCVCSTIVTVTVQQLINVS